MLKNYLTSVRVAIAISMVALVATSTSSSAQTLASDQPDYSPGNIATFTGTGFLPGETVTLVVNHYNHPQDPNICHTPWDVVADASGNFETTWLVCKEALNLTLIASADGATSGRNASVIFTDGSNSLNQGQNGPAASPTTVCLTSGNLNNSKAHYVEGYSVPFQMVMTGLTINTTYNLSIKWRTEDGGKHAFDYITSYNRLEPHYIMFGHSAEIVDPSLLYGNCSSAPDSLKPVIVNTFDIPAPSVDSASLVVNGKKQPLTSFNALPASEKKMTIYEGTITNFQYYRQDKLDSTKADFSAARITFTASDTTVVIAWGGHLAADADWGAGNSLANISGSSYHMILDSLTPGNVGAQDKQMSAQAVLVPTCVNSPVTAVCGDQPVTCFGGSNGSASVTAGGATTYRYAWSNGGTTSSIAGLTAGTYSVTVTESDDIFGCTATCSFTVTQPSALSANKSVTNVSCNGGSNGLASISASGGTAPYSGTGSFPGLTAGTYAYTVTDAHGCTATVSAIITEPALPLSAGTSVVTNVSCNGGGNGSASVSASGGTPPYNGTGTVSGLTAGNYSYTVTDAHGCTATTSVSITEPQALSASSVTTTTLCNGGTMMVTVTASGGTRPYSGDGTVPVTAGFYSYTVTDANGCTATTSINVTQPSELSAFATGNDVLCNGGTSKISVSAQGGVPPYSNTGDIDEPAGTYTYTVTDFNGCTATASISISEPSALSASSNAGVILCNGNSTTVNVSADGGVSAYSGTGGFSVQAGPYSYTVADANGCTATTSGNITEPPALSVSSSAYVPCNGGGSSVTVTASGGTPPYSGDGTYPETNGTYSFTVSDANGCTATTSVTVSQPPDLSAYSSAGSISCNGGSTTVTVSAAGGGAPYQGTGDVPETAGTYSYTVTDANGCTATTSITITEPQALSAFSNAGNVLCNGGTVSFNVTAGGGSAPYAGTGSLTEDAGTYSYTVTDAGGCTASISVTITEPDVLSISGIPTNVTVAGGHDGAVELTVTGGTKLYAYAWTGPNSFKATTQNIVNVYAGTYFVTVTDAHNCSTTGSWTTTQPLTSTCSGFQTVTQGGWGATPKGNNPAFFLQNNFGTAFPTGLVVGCTSRYTIALTSAVAVHNFLPSTSTPVVLTRSYTNPTFKTTSGSTSYRNVLAGQLVALTLNIGFDGYPGFSSNGYPLKNMFITVGVFKGFTVGQLLDTANNALGGCGTNYLLSDLNNAASAINEAYDGGVCNGTCGYLTCTAPSNGPVINHIDAAIFPTDGNCLTNYGGSITSIAEGGKDPYNYTWSNGATDATITNVLPGIYSLTIEDAMGMTVTFTTTVSSDSSIVAAADYAYSANEQTLTFSDLSDAPESGVTQSWYWTFGDGSSSTSQSPVYQYATGGLYTVCLTTTYTDNNITCSDTHCRNICVPLATSVTSSGSVLCHGESISLMAGAGYSSYLWSTGEIKQNITVPAGFYSVIVTDNNGCTGAASFTVIEPPALNAISSGTGSCSVNGNDGTASVAVTGGSGNYSYLWSTASAGSSINNLPAGTYSVTITDANACTVGSSYTILQSIGLSVSAGSNTPVCSGLALNLNSDASSGVPPYRYLWTGPGNFSAATANPSVNSVTTSFSGTYSLIVTDYAGCVARATTTAMINYCTATVNLKLFIEGYYIGGGLMQPVMDNEQVNGANPDQTDTIRVILRNTSNPRSVVQTAVAILMSDGSATAIFDSSHIGHYYYLSVKHRNTIQTYSRDSIFITPETAFDFSASVSSAYAYNEAQVDDQPAVYAFYSGDINQDENVDLIDYPPMDLGINGGFYGYYTADLNGDGNVDLLDFPILDRNINGGVFSRHP